MGSLNMTIGNHLETGQGSGTPAKVSTQVRIEGVSHFGWGFLYGMEFHRWERRVFFERRITALQRGVGRHAPVTSWAVGAI